MNKNLPIGIQKNKLFWRVLVVQGILVCSLTLFGYSANLKEKSDAEVSKEVSGKVVDENNKPVPGANIIIKGTNSGTVTDADGKYSIIVDDEKSVLVCSFIGFVTQEITVGTLTSIDFSLKPDLATLSEIIVVGYGTQQKRDITGSVSSIKSSEMNLGGTTSNIATAIQGRAAGVNVQQNDFSPGGAISITVRGGSSINSTNEPLYVVDGLISENGKNINPNDIADIQILKDASSAAVYGARGANGVVLITTKKGKQGKALIEADFSDGVQNSRYTPALINGQQYANVQNAIAAENGTSPVFPSGFPIVNTNWWALATQQASVHNRTLSFSKNEKDSKFYLSGNYFKQDGVLRFTNFERYSVRLGVERRFSDKINVGANLYGSVSNSSKRDYGDNILGSLYGILTAPPSIPVYNSDGTYYQFKGKDNAFALLKEPTNLSTNRLFNGNMFLDYEILKNLTYHISSGFEYTLANNGQYIPRTLVSGLANHGIATQQMSTFFRILNENYLTYKYANDIHSMSAVVGSSSQKDVNEYLYAGSSNFSSDAYLFYNLQGGASPVQGQTLPASYKAEILYRSYFTRLNYSYKDKFLASFSFRDDQSSRFPVKNRNGYFPAGSVAWRVINEPFMQNVQILSDLKLRVSYGITGNDRVAGPTDYLSQFSSWSTTIAPSGTPGSFVPGVEPALLPNTNLKWESTTQTVIGLDVGFLEGRINATIDVYDKVTKDLLLKAPVGAWWGSPSGTQLVNSGSVGNRGIELSINSTNVSTGNFSWKSSFNVAYNRQQVLKLAPSLLSIPYTTSNPSGVVSAQQFTKLETGKEMGVIYGYQYAGVIKTGDAHSAQPVSNPGDPKYVDVNNDGKITPADRTYLGNTIPRYIAGLSNEFRYKNFDLNIFFQGAFDYHKYNMNRLVLESTTGTDVLNRWVATTNENTSVPRQGYFLTPYGSYVNSRFVEDATYIRLKMVSLGYNLPESVLRKTKFIDGLRVYITGQNLATITKYRGTDPEVNGHSGSNYGGGIDFNSFPAFRTFTAGLKLTIR